MNLKLTAAAVAAGLCISLGMARAAEEAKPPKTIKEIMKIAHKDKDKESKKTMVEIASEGKASEKQLKALVDYYKTMTDLKPKKGEESSWKEKSAALLKATEALAKEPTKKEAIADFKKANNCKACHTPHK